MAKSVITNIARKKMARARYDGTPLEKVKYIALGDGGVNEDGEVIYPLPENINLQNELIRKEYDSCTKISDTSYEYAIDVMFPTKREKTLKYALKTVKNHS